MFVNEFTAAIKQGYEKWYLPLKCFDKPASSASMLLRHFRKQEKQNAKSVLRGCFSDEKYLFENISIFDFPNVCMSVQIFQTSVKVTRMKK